MAARRITYLALLALAAALHYAYGQYITHYMLIFLLCLPLISLLISIPEALTSNASLIGGSDVCRNNKSSVKLAVFSYSHTPPEAWRVTVESRNVFTGRVISRQKVEVGRTKSSEQAFSPDTSQLGSVRYKIKHAFIYDHLGLIPIPVKKGGSVSVLIMPLEETPVPEPDLIGASANALRAKPFGFSEEHELRPYREGDPLNLIHWKLSRKQGGYILREPQEVERKDIVLIIAPPALYDDHRSMLEQLEYLNARLLESEIPYLLIYGQKSFTINSPDDYDNFIRGVLSVPRKTEEALSADRGKDALIYHIRPRKGDGK